MTISLITDAKVLTKAIASIKERGAKLDTDIHVAACSVLAHVAAHRNKNLVANLCAALPKSARRKSLIDWFETFGPYKVSYATAAVEMPALASDDWASYIDSFEDTIETACKTPFWVEKESGKKDRAPLDMKAIVAYLNRKATDKTADSETQANIALVAQFAANLAAGGQMELPLSTTNAVENHAVH